MKINQYHRYPMHENSKEKMLKISFEVIKLTNSSMSQTSNMRELQTENVKHSLEGCKTWKLICVKDI